LDLFVVPSSHNYWGRIQLVGLGQFRAIEHCLQNLE
jgi:hypothetical protein